VPKDLKYYCQKFSRLKVDKSRGIAPHKPIMLLSVIEQFEQRKITVNQIYPSASLIATFSKYWSYLDSEKHQDSSYLPFFYLKSDGFWHPKIKLGLEEVISGFKPKSLKSLQSLILYAFLDDELFLLLQDSVFRSVLINTLICGLKIINFLTQNIVDGSHIKPFSEFRDDRIDNGLSLCKNHHWAFDRIWSGLMKIKR